MTEALAVWVYGVMPGDAQSPPPRRGVDGRHDAELIRHAGLAALASAVPLEEFEPGALEQRLEDLESLEALARAHERVLDDALPLGGVVPFPICTIYEGPERVREMLERERRSLAAALQRLSGTAEWGVKAYLVARGEAAPEKVAAGRPASGTEYLARKHDERVAQEAERRTADATVALIHHTLGERAVGAVLRPPQDPRLSGRGYEMTLNAAYLVPEARSADFRELVHDLGNLHAEHGVVLDLTGPWPAYHFVGPAIPR